VARGIGTAVTDGHAGSSVRSEQRHSVESRRSTIPQVLVGLDGAVTAANTAAGALLCVAPSSLVGRDFMDEVLPDRRPGDVLVVQAVATGKLDEVRLTRRTWAGQGAPSPGEQIWVTALRNASGAVCEMSVILLDLPTQPWGERGGERRAPAGGSSSRT
jgi:PAS domain-containing protein